MRRSLTILLFVGRLNRLHRIIGLSNRFAILSFGRDVSTTLRFAQHDEYKPREARLEQTQAFVRKRNRQATTKPSLDGE